MLLWWLLMIKCLITQKTPEFLLSIIKSVDCSAINELKNFQSKVISSSLSSQEISPSFFPSRIFVVGFAAYLYDCRQFMLSRKTKKICNKSTCRKYLGPLL